jgi:hypothetical protein
MCLLPEGILILPDLEVDGKIISTSESQNSLQISPSLLRKILISLNVSDHILEKEHNFSLMCK